MNRSSVSIFLAVYEMPGGREKGVLLTTPRFESGGIVLDLVWWHIGQEEVSRNGKLLFMVRCKCVSDEFAC